MHVSIAFNGRLNEVQLREPRGWNRASARGKMLIDFKNAFFGPIFKINVHCARAVHFIGKQKKTALCKSAVFFVSVGKLSNSIYQNV